LQFEISEREKRINYEQKFLFMSLSQLLFFKAPIFPKLTTAQRYHVEISCIEFHPNRSENMESAGRDSFTPSSEVWLSVSKSARTSSSFDTFYKELLHRISGKSHTWFSRRNYVKDVRTNGQETFLPSRRKERVIII
jgi:hypothetical protein